MGQVNQFSKIKPSKPPMTCELTLSARPPRQRLSSEVQRCLQRILLGFNRSMRKKKTTLQKITHAIPPQPTPAQDKREKLGMSLQFQCVLLSLGLRLCHWFFAATVWCSSSILLVASKKKHPWSCSRCSLLLAERSFEKEMQQSDKTRKHRTVTWSKKNTSTILCFHDILLLVWETGFFSHSTFS